MAKGLEAKVAADKMRERLDLIGTFLGPEKLGQPATLGTEFTNPIRYIDGVKKYAEEIRSKYGQREIDKHFSFNAEGYVSAAAAKNEKLTIGDYMGALVTLKLDQSDFELLKSVKDKNYHAYLTELNAKVKEGKASFKERGLYYLVAALGKQVTDNLEADITKYAEKMYEQQRTPINKLRVAAEKNPKGPEAKTLKRLEGKFGTIEDSRKKIPDEIDGIFEEMKVPQYERARYREAA